MQPPILPTNKKIKELVEQQKIGKILAVQVDSSSYLPDWHPHEDYRKGYAARKELGGGIVLTAIHELDYLHWIFGDVHEVFSVSEKLSDLKLSVEDYSAVIMKFENNVVAEVHLDFFQRPYFKSFKIKGTTGIITWNTDANLVKVFNAKTKKWKTVMDSTHTLLTSTAQNNKMYVDELTHFFQCVHKRTKTINDLEGGIRSMKTALALKKSSKLKRTISV
ncbi:Gfo/Idh/MocA family protein [Nitrosarchaeum sp. AC2]|uniref:Gfo/Idh/MocA family protein n=1 Tax=Nitrosarchaeum sp. AC2 TaxID=2259673 RepID=UPI001C54B1F7|nr:Gfo/Idh/MocA family oxidoreductase [Nitrosarchaeum sp. AC2]